MTSTIKGTTPTADEYRFMFDNMIINPDKLSEVNRAVALINAGKEKYQQIQDATGVPWFFIGMIHYRECNCDFTRHLHNGDPLTARTVQVPKGRPVKGNPPFTFFESAVDALAYQGLTVWNDWSISGMLLKLHQYNGFGYEQYHSINSPYLWSYTQFYSKGLYTKDGVYNAEAVSKQAGVAAILRRVMETNNLYAAVAFASGGLILLVAVALLYLFNKN